MIQDPINERDVITASLFILYLVKNQEYMDSKQIKSFDNVNDCVKHFVKQGHDIKKIAMAFANEHNLTIGKISINLAPMKRMKKKERAEHLKALFPAFFTEKRWLERFETEFAKWNAK